MDENDRLDSMARWMWDARQRRQTFCNLPNHLRPTSIPDASSLIVENCWNGGVVLGDPQSVQVGDLVGIAGRLSISCKTVGEGNAEDPCATLAWVANHLAERGRDLKAGMVVITGSVIPTVSIASGDRALFTVDGLGEVAMEVF